MARFPGRWLICIALVAMMIPWAAALPSSPWGQPPARQDIRFALGAFDPLLDPLPPGARLVSPDAAGPFVAQFAGRAGAAEASAVAAAGGSIAAVLGGGAFVVVGAPGTGGLLADLSGVRWVGLVPPAMRLHPAAIGSDLVLVSYAGSVHALLGDIRQAGARPIAVGSASALVGVGAGGGAALAGMPRVLFVAPYSAPTHANFNAVRTDGLRQPANASAYTSASGALWTFNGNAGDPRFLGYTGDGVVVDVTDEGVDGTHPAFSGRLGSATTWSTVPAWQDLLGHGTHVAASAAGSGAYFAADGPLAPGLYAGAAPGATLVSQNLNPGSMNYTAMAGWAASAGATVSINSWGDGSGAAQGAYTVSAAEYDALTMDASSTLAGAQPILFIFAAGNENNAAQSINAPATAKNVLAVGAVGNDYVGLATSDQVAPFSAFGPTDDGRVKPDLVAPGEMVASARSSAGPSPTGALPPYAGTSYAYLNGTSMAAPQAGGAAAVATEFLREARGVTATPALLKALLINGAQPLPGLPWPGPAQGWGRLDAAASLIGGGGHRVDFVEEGFVTFTDDGPLDVVQFTVPLDAGEDFRVSLVWTDPANSPLAPTALVNDLDLEVRDPTGSTVFVGNRINATAGYSTSGAPGHLDESNNVEAVRIQAAGAGNWSIFVRSYRLVSSAQSFALAYSGAVNRSGADLAVEAAGLAGFPTQVESGDLVTAEGEVVNRGGSTAGSVVVEAVDARDALAAPFAAQSLGSLTPGARAVFALPFQPPDGDNEVAVRVRFAGNDSDPANDEARLAFFVRRVQPQLAGAAEAVALPGQPANFSLMVTNRGNVDDVFLLTETPATRDPAWPLTFDASPLALAPGESAPVAVAVGVPANASLGAFTALEIVVSSSLNTSRTDALALTARAGAVRAVGVTPLSPSASAAPGGTVQVDVSVSNLGNSAEEVDVAAEPQWSAGAWSATAANATLPRGASAVLSLALTNNDTGPAGYRGDLRLRATLRSTGETFDAFVPVYLEARACLVFGALADAATATGARTVLPVVLTNCGNVRLSGPLEWLPPSGFDVNAPASFDIGPGNAAFLDANLTGTRLATEGAHALALRADAGGGLWAAASFRLVHTTAVDLAVVGLPESVTLTGGAASFRVVLLNRGGAGPVDAPLVGGLPPGWHAAVAPSRLAAAANASISFDVTVGAGGDTSPKEVDLSLVFYPGSPREGQLSPLVHGVLPAPPSTPSRPGTPAWPGSLGAALAVLAGAAVALAAAAARAPSKGLARACTACGQKAPRFDTLLNPRCSACGGSLAKGPPP